MDTEGLFFHECFKTVGLSLYIRTSFDAHAAGALDKLGASGYKESSGSLKGHKRVAVPAFSVFQRVKLPAFEPYSLRSILNQRRGCALS